VSRVVGQARLVIVFDRAGNQPGMEGDLDRNWILEPAWAWRGTAFAIILICQLNVIDMAKYSHFSPFMA